MEITPTGQTRRDFFKLLMVTGAALTLGRKRLFAAKTDKPAETESAAFDYQYRTFSVEHLREAKHWFEKLRKNGQLSANKTFQSYIGGFCFDQRAVMPDAKSFIIFAVPQLLQSITFHHQGEQYDIKIPTGYVDNGITGAMLKSRIRKDIIRDPEKKLKGRVRLPLKTLAVRSGLAEYGRNNITYVNGYGSYHALYGLFTDKELDDNWGPMKMLRLCKGCSVCTRECPTKCIRTSNFVIDEGRCLALYSEVPGGMPAWIKPDAHNALIGCLKCQFDCPANAEGSLHIEKIAEMTEEETDLILKQGTDKEVLQKIREKLVTFPIADDLAYFSRNLKLVLASKQRV